MGLRITQGIVYSRALQDIRASLRGSVNLQQQIATGRRVNRPSDDPAATLRILPLNADVRDLGLLRDNARLARETIVTASSSLEDASLTMQRVRELTLQAANGTLNAADRASLGQEVDQLLNQILSVGNAQRANRYLFGGTANDAPPFVRETVGGETRIVYRGNEDALRVDVAPGITTDLNLPGNEIFQRRNRGPAVFEGETGAGSGRGINTGLGEDILEVTFAGLNTTGVTGIAQGTGQRARLEAWAIRSRHLGRYRSMARPSLSSPGTTTLRSPTEELYR